MTEFRFNEDFANNWKSGQTVTCEEKEDGYLVDKVALIEKDFLQDVHHNLQEILSR